MTDLAIRTEDLTKHFGAVQALEGLTLEVARGEILGFLGSNGAGKTTTIRLLFDLLRPTRGRAFLNGHDCHREGLRARAGVGYLPGEMPIYPTANARTLIAFLAALDSRPPNREWTATLLRRFDLSDLVVRRRLVDLSHGMKRKVGLVQALMGLAPVLVLDEPTAGLDPLMIEAFCETMTELRAKGHTIFLSSHVLSEVERLCNRIALVAGGRLVRLSGIDEIRRDFPRRVRVTFRRPAGDPPRLDGMTIVHVDPHEWRLDVRGELGALLQDVDGSNIADIHVESFRLEDYILGLYGDRRP
ncbi:MAG: ABC transporter ATP-binding protein [Acidobacteriota bacterium]